MSETLANVITQHRTGRLQSMNCIETLLWDVLTNDMLNKRKKYTDLLDYCRGAASAKPTDKFEKSELETETEVSLSGLTMRKVDDLFSWFDEITSQLKEKLTAIKSTAIPEVSDEEKDEVVDEILEMILTLTLDRMNSIWSDIIAEHAQQGIQITIEQAEQIASDRGLDSLPSEEELLNSIDEMQQTAVAITSKKSDDKVDLLKKMALDVVQETSFFAEVKKIQRDFAEYPVCCGRIGDTFTIDKKWKSDKVKKDIKVRPTITRVSPYNLYWSSDSTTPNDGMAFAERINMRRFDVETLLSSKDKAYDKEVIMKLLEEKNFGGLDWLGLSQDGEVEESRYNWSALPNQTMPVMRMWVLVSGYQLKGYEKEFDIKIVPHKQYRLLALFSDGYILYKKLFKGCEKTDYVTTGFIQQSGFFLKKSLPEVLMMADREMVKLRENILRHTAYLATPPQIRDGDAFDDIEDDHVLLPNNSYTYTGVMIGRGKPAEFLQIEDRINSFRSLEQDLQNRADMESGILRFAMGQMQGFPSAIRSTEMFTKIVNSALKTTKAKLTEFIGSIVVPAMQNIVDYVVEEYPEKFSGLDAHVYVEGIEATIGKEMGLNLLRETLDYISRYAGVIDPQTGQPIITAQVIKTILKMIMSESGIKDEDLPVDLQEGIDVVNNNVMGNSSNLLGGQANVA